MAFHKSDKTRLLEEDADAYQAQPPAYVTASAPPASQAAQPSYNGNAAFVMQDPFNHVPAAYGTLSPSQAAQHPSVAATAPPVSSYGQPPPFNQVPSPSGYQQQPSSLTPVAPPTGYQNVTVSSYDSAGTVPIEKPILVTGPSAPGEQPDDLPPAYGDDLSCWNGVKRDRHLLCLVLSLGLWTILILRIVVATGNADGDTTRFFTNPGAFYGLFFGVYALYLLECGLSGTFAFLRNRMSEHEAGDKVHGMRSTPPSIRFTIQNYHYETRTRTRSVSDGNGGTRTETYTEQGLSCYVMSYHTLPHSFLANSKSQHPLCCLAIQRWPVAGQLPFLCSS
eukprot:m.38932 g.38932  ORF g.38932 m.38932 type:complete len:336 (-) comp12624_c0_seq1:385-1392(-)